MMQRNSAKSLWKSYHSSGKRKRVLLKIQRRTVSWSSDEVHTQAKVERIQKEPTFRVGQFKLLNQTCQLKLSFFVCFPFWNVHAPDLISLGQCTGMVDSGLTRTSLVTPVSGKTGKCLLSSSPSSGLSQFIRPIFIFHATCSCYHPFSF